MKKLSNSKKMKMEKMGASYGGKNDVMDFVVMDKKKMSGKKSKQKK